MAMWYGRRVAYAFVVDISWIVGGGVVDGDG